MADLHYIFGIHAVQAALEKQPENCQEIIVQSGERNHKVNVICDLARQAGVRLLERKKPAMDDLADRANHQGVMLKTKPVKRYREEDLEPLIINSKSTPLVLALDSVQDPHNLGACLRTAEAMGVNAVIAPKDRACDITPVVRKVASGAAERIPFIRVTNLVRTLASLQENGLWVTGAAGEASESLHRIDFTVPTVLVMGAEGKGMRELTQKNCDYVVSIPMQGSVGSYNVSVACGICLYEIARQRAAIE